MKVINMRYDRVVVELDLEDVEFIGMELPGRDRFTCDWHDVVITPMLKLAEIHAADENDRPGISIVVNLR